MSMFKTIGLITGGVVIGVVSTSVLSSKGYKLSDSIEGIFNRHKENPSNDDEFCTKPQEENNNSKLSSESKNILRKSMQVDRIVSEIKEIIHTDNVSDILYKINELDGVISEMKDIVNLNTDNDSNEGDEVEEDNFYETEEDMIDRVVEEVIEEGNKRINDISNEIIEKFKESEDK